MLLHTPVRARTHTHMNIHEHDYTRPYTTVHDRTRTRRIYAKLVPGLYFAIHWCTFMVIHVHTRTFIQVYVHTQSFLNTATLILCSRI